MSTGATAEQTIAPAEVEEAETETTEVADTQEAAPEGQAPAQTASEVDELAREMGWAPQSEWRGPKESWKSAKEYIRHGSVIQRDLKTRNDVREREFNDRVERIAKVSQKALDNQRRELDERHAQRMREAAAVGDLQAFDHAQQRREADLKRFDAEVAETSIKPPAGQPELPAEVQEFGRRNTWFNIDPVMTDAAVGLSNRYLTQYPGMALNERLDLVEREIRKEFSHKFGPANGSTTAPKAPQVEGGLRPIKTSAVKGWESLPNEAKQAGNGYIKQGLFKTKDDYAKSYWDQG